MLVNDAIGKHLVAPGVLYVIHKYVYKKTFCSILWHNIHLSCHACGLLSIYNNTVYARASHVIFLACLITEIELVSIRVAEQP